MPAKLCNNLTQSPGETIRPDWSVSQVCARLTELGIGDVVKHRIRETEHEAEALKAYIAAG
jgi:hypothetical protein